MLICLKSSNIEGNLGRSYDSYLLYHIIISYIIILLYHIILYYIHCCVLIVSIGYASCTWPNKRACPVSDQKTHCFQSYDQGYRKTGNN